MTFDEPRAWLLPLRQQLGAVLLAAGRAKAAEAEYRRDLDRHPENGWSLLGLRESLKAQQRFGEAKQVDARFARAWATADVKTVASRF